jgi:hypothetical protein
VRGRQRRTAADAAIQHFGDEGTSGYAESSACVRAEIPSSTHTRTKLVQVSDETSLVDGVAFWGELTAAGGEGKVVKPLAYIAQVAAGSHAPPAPPARYRPSLRPSSTFTSSITATSHRRGTNAGSQTCSSQLSCRDSGVRLTTAPSDQPLQPALSSSASAWCGLGAADPGLAQGPGDGITLTSCPGAAPPEPSATCGWQPGGIFANLMPPRHIQCRRAAEPDDSQ